MFRLGTGLLFIEEQQLDDLRLLSKRFQPWPKSDIFSNSNPGIGKSFQGKLTIPHVHWSINFRLSCWEVQTKCYIFSTRAITQLSDNYSCLLGQCKDVFARERLSVSIKLFLDTFYSFVVWYYYKRSELWFYASKIIEMF